jgi:serine phosphatase RsbU (regulator of sigma subunit)
MPVNKPTRMKKLWLLCLYLCLGVSTADAQQVYPDSLTSMLSQAGNDTLRLNLIKAWCLRVAKDDLANLPAASSAYIEELKTVADNERLVSYFKTLGDIYRNVDSINQSIDYYSQAAALAEQTGQKDIQSLMYNEIGNIYLNLGDFNQAIDNHFKSLSIREEVGNSQGVATSLNNIGAIYFKIDSLRTAMDYYLRSLEIEKRNKNDYGIAGCYTNIGSICEAKLKRPEFMSQIGQLYDSALWYYRESAAIFEKLDRKYDIARSYISLANIYNRQGLPEAKEYYNKALALYEQIGAKQGLAETYLAIGIYYNENLEYKKSIEYLLKSQEYGREVRSKEIMSESYRVLSDAWAQLGEFKKAFEAHREYTRFDDMLKNENEGKKFTRLEMQHTFDKKQREQAFLRQQEKRRQALVTFGILLVLVFVSVLAYVMYRSYKTKQRDNVLLAQQKLEIETQRDEIAAQRDLVTSQRDQIVKQKEEITDSIHYASRIQSAILPPEEFRQELMHEHFVLFKPRDIVSGDFYWIANKNGKNVIVGADCTGHGVPGAFMSMLGVSFLHQIVNEFEELSAANILNQLREQVIRSLHQTGKEGENKDGMDITLLVIDEKTQELEFAGAYNSCIIIRNGEVNELKADRMPIGIYSEKSGELFKSQKFQLQKNDTIYCASDGYEDQFGGPEGKKLKAKAFKEILLSIQDKSMSQQKEYLENFMMEWRKGYEQVDDVLVIGMRI